MSAARRPDETKPSETRSSRSSTLKRLRDDPEFRRKALLWLTQATEVAVGLPLFLFFAPRLHGELPLFVILLALNLIAERMPISIYGESDITVGFVFTLAIIALFGAPGVAISGPLEHLSRRFGRRPYDVRLIVRGSRTVITYTAAAGAYSLFAHVNPQHISFGLIAGSLASTTVAFAVSALFVVWTISLETAQPWRTVWSNSRWVALHYLAFGVIGVSLVASFIGLGYWGILAYLTPVVLLRISTKLYVDKTAENVDKLKRQNRALEVANLEIRTVSEELRQTYGATLETLVAALEARDQETKGHSIRVARYMLNIAEALGVKPETPQWLDMQHGALLHDVGKIGVRDSILLKPGSLTPEEWENMRKHPDIGYNILKEVKFLHGAAEIVLAHHERWDGAGYPKGLRAENIPLGSRIFAVVDTFDTMTSDRVYRKALSLDEALKEILRCGGSQFDPLVVEAFLDIYDAWVIEHEKLHDLTDVRRAA